MLEINNIEKIFKTRDFSWSFGPVSLKIEESKFYSIVGKSGSGKSTFLNILSGLLKPDSGSVFFDEKNINKMTEKEITKFRNKNMGFIFQDFCLINELTVLENVVLPLKISKDKNLQCCLNRAEELLDNMEILDKKNSKPNQLSGGQKQRVAIARALINNPRLILADEPTGSLDEETSVKITNLLIEKLQKNTTLILVTHDKDIAEKADEKLKIENGNIFKI